MNISKLKLVLVAITLASAGPLVAMAQPGGAALHAGEEIIVKDGGEILGRLLGSTSGAARKEAEETILKKSGEYFGDRDMSAKQVEEKVSKMNETEFNKWHGAIAASLKSPAFDNVTYEAIKSVRDTHTNTASATTATHADVIGSEKYNVGSNYDKILAKIEAKVEPGYRSDALTIADDARALEKAGAPIVDKGFCNEIENHNLSATAIEHEKQIFSDARKAAEEYSHDCAAKAAEDQIVNDFATILNNERTINAANETAIALQQCKLFNNKFVTDVAAMHTFPEAPFTRSAPDAPLTANPKYHCE